MAHRTIYNTQKKIAAFGAIPFDHYVLENWDFEAHRFEDYKQWRALVKKYLARSPHSRRAYKEKAEKIRDGTPKLQVQPLLTAANIDRALRPFQTAQERNFSQLATNDRPVWVQTCYDSKYDLRLAEITYEAPGSASPPEDALHLIDDAMYNTGGNMKLLLEQLRDRLPGMFDRDLGLPQSRLKMRADAPKDLGSQSDRMEIYVFVLDKECAKRKFIKILWLDCFGRQLLLGKIDPGDVEEMLGMFLGGFSMAEAVDSYGLQDSDFSDEEGNPPPKRKRVKLIQPKKKNEAVETDSDTEWETMSEGGLSC